MSHRQPYTDGSASDSGHGTLQDSPKTNQAASTTVSEGTSLIKRTNGHPDTRDEEDETFSERTNQPDQSAQGLLHAVLGFKAAGSSHFDSYSRPNTSDISLALVNSGSVARDHLASERTFLAYVRTSLAIASAGVGASFVLLVEKQRLHARVLALAQILSVAEYYSDATPVGHTSIRKRRVEAWARPLGATAVVIALFTLFVGVARYFTIQKALVGGLFPISRIGTCLVSVLFGALIVATFGVLFHPLR